VVEVVTVGVPTAFCRSGNDGSGGETVNGAAAGAVTPGSVGETIVGPAGVPAPGTFGGTRPGTVSGEVAAPAVGGTIVRLLPAGPPTNPSYRKVNPSDAPIMLMALSSELVERSKLYDLASSILQQKLAQVSGVGQVVVGGGALPAVRVEVNPGDLNAKGVALEEIRAALATANVNKPKGSLANGQTTWSIQATDQLFSAKDYIPLVVSYKKGAALRLGDVARVTDGLENVQATGLANGKPAILLIIFRQPGANIIETADRVQALIPELQASLPPTMDLRVVLNTTRTIRASVMEVERTSADADPGDEHPAERRDTKVRCPCGARTPSMTACEVRELCRGVADLCRDERRRRRLGVGEAAP